MKGTWNCDLNATVVQCYIYFPNIHLPNTHWPLLCAKYHASCLLYDTGNNLFISATFLKATLKKTLLILNFTLPSKFLSFILIYQLATNIKTTVLILLFSLVFSYMMWELFLNLILLFTYAYTDRNVHVCMCIHTHVHSLLHLYLYIHLFSFMTLDLLNECMYRSVFNSLTATFISIRSASIISL